MSKKSFSRLILFGVFLMLFVSCARKVTNSHKDLVIYPAPPDSTRIQFLTSYSNGESVTGKRSGFKRFILGEADPLPIQKPYGIGLHGSKIYVCDATIDGLEIIDLEHNTFTYFIPKGRGKLTQPNNCFIDEQGFLYIADTERHQVVIFDNNGDYVNAIGDPASFKPTDVAVFEDKIYVANAKENKINIYRKGSYELLGSFPESTKGSPDFIYTPTNLCM